MLRRARGARCIRATGRSTLRRLTQQAGNFADHATAERGLDEDYALVLVQPTPAVMPRERWLDVLDDYIMHAYDVEEQRVEVDGDVAAVLQRVRMEATALGQDRTGVFVISDIWRRRGDEWRIWRRHSTPLAAGPMPDRA